MLNACLKHFPSNTQGVQADWNAYMAIPSLKAHTLRPAFRQELASYDPMIVELMATPMSRQDLENVCRRGFDKAS